jgi:manganese transport protein
MTDLRFHAVPFEQMFERRCLELIMQGFVGFTIPLWARRVITMVPAFVIALTCQATTAMVVSQVVLSFCLPLPLIALVVLASRSSVMGSFANGPKVTFAAAATTVLIVLLNLVLIREVLF